MNASIRTQVTFTNQEVIDILKKHLSRKGLKLAGEVELQAGCAGFTISNVDMFRDEPEQVAGSISTASRSIMEDLALQAHARRVF